MDCCVFGSEPCASVYAIRFWSGDHAYHVVRTRSMRLTIRRVRRSRIARSANNRSAGEFDCAAGERRSWPHPCSLAERTQMVCRPAWVRSATALRNPGRVRSPRPHSSQRAESYRGPAGYPRTSGQARTQTTAARRRQGRAPPCRSPFPIPINPLRRCLKSVRGVIQAARHSMRRNC
jgi:hypothetical protein